KIVEFVADGAIAEHVELLEKVPAGLFEVLQIPGVGPKAAKAMWTELGIESLDDLKGTSDDDLAALPRMGKKTVENIRQATRFAEAAGERVPIGRARPIALAIVERLREVSSVERAEFAGSLRRGRETIGDLDFLVACSDVKAVRETFVEMPEVTQVLVSGDTKTSVRLRSGDGPKAVHVQADLRIVPIAAWGAALMYFTGSKEHNVRLRELAIQRGQRLNEYGLWQGTDERPQDAEGAEPVAAGSEEEIYRALDLPWIPPELREDRGELAWARSDARGELIRLDDVRAELHAHTTASDGRLSILELAQEAKRRGFHTIAVTDHSKSQPIAGGLSDERLVEHIEAVHAADREIDGITILAGSEVDILADGSLDYDDELLARLDVVVASPHVALRQDPDAATERLLRAVRHPLVHILGHPTGRIVQRREGLAPDLDALVAAAAEHDVALELNANWNRLDLRDTHLRLALDAGCKIAIDTDAHDVPHFDFLIYGILTARRAGLPADACINTWSAERLHGWLRSKR
ncbi:MAG: DNA polymerase/3'-5' exonuclease PolX, partial [Acidobacteriota bacterium]